MGIDAKPRILKYDAEAYGWVAEDILNK